METIFALATYPAKSGVAIVRVSGSLALNSLKYFGINIQPQDRIAKFAVLKDGEDEIDQALYFCFNAPHSFTGEDVVEYHLHGSIAVINSVLSLLSKIPNFRLAEPGEFAKRAFMNNKMDLTKAEGLADLIEAETKLQQRQALRQMSGELENLYDKWRNSLIHAMAFIEAYIDFPDEDLPQEIITELNEQINELRFEITNHLSDKRGEKLREGIYIAIYGAPNVGKSTLLNNLAKRDVAIVSNIPGTTRDIIEVRLDLNGYLVTIADTAGLRVSDDVIENEGIKRAKNAVANADLKIAIFDASVETPVDKDSFELIDDNTIVILNKIDAEKTIVGNIGKHNFIRMSLLDNIGVNELLELITVFIRDNYAPISTPLITRIRYRNLLEEAMKALMKFDLSKDSELAAEDLRVAASKLGQITGRIDVENILDKIFSSFCIGK